MMNHAYSQVESLAVPNTALPSKMLGNPITEQPQKAVPSKRYMRRSSVTRYSLEQMTVPTNMHLTNGGGSSYCFSDRYVHPSESNLCAGPSPEETQTDYESALCSDNNSTKAAPAAIPKKKNLKHQHQRYGRRSSVTRYSLQKSAIAETRSLSPVPFSRRGSMTKIRVERVSASSSSPSSADEHDASVATNSASSAVIAHHRSCSQEGEEQPVAEEQQLPRPKSRYHRRCSVTRYSLDAAQAVAKQHYAATQLAVKVIVEEPADTIDSVEHRQMLANDTIESSGAGDLIVGWNQATASFLEEDDDEYPTTDDEDDLCDEMNQDSSNTSASDRSNTSSKPRLFSTSSRSRSLPWWAIVSQAGDENNDHGASRTGNRDDKDDGNYIWGVLQKNFSTAPFWIKSLGSEIDGKRSRTTARRFAAQAGLLGTRASDTLQFSRSTPSPPSA